MRLKIIATAVAGGKIHKKGDVIDVPKGLAEHLVGNDLAEEHKDEVSKPPLRTDGPTLEEWLAKGSKAETYPPEGYAPRTK